MNDPTGENDDEFFKDNPIQSMQNTWIDRKNKNNALISKEKLNENIK